MMNESHDKPRIAQKSPRANDDTIFDARKIKKERNDITHLDNGQGINIAREGNGTIVLMSELNDNSGERGEIQRSTGSRLGNGFHAGDLLQDISAKFANSSSHGLGPAAKNDKIRLMIEDSISDESKSHVQEIFLQVEQLKIEEKLLLYLKLPSSLTNPGGAVDPLRQPLNPLGNRYEIHQTIMWIKTHLEEDPDVSLPKQEVYDEYNFFCTRNVMKPLSTADFGKVMKQVYPRVRPRRLGTRGNSRYCYAGMRKRVKLKIPSLPTVTGAPAEENFDDTITEEMLGAASTLIREWAESTLGHKFPTLSALARHLVDNLCVDTRSLSAVCILSASGDAPDPPNKEPLNSSLTPPIKSSKLRDAQLQLQKKLQQREHIQKNPPQLKTTLTDNGKSSTTPKSCKKSKSSLSPTSTTPKPANPPSNRSRKLPRSSSQPTTATPAPNCDSTAPRTGEVPKNGLSLRSLTPSHTNSTQNPKLPSKNPRKRASLDQTRTNSTTSPEKQQKLDEQQHNSTILLPKPTKLPAKITVIPPSNLKSTKTMINGNFEAQTILTKDQIRLLQENPAILTDKTTDKLGTIDAGALDDYLNGGNNSQEPEEELLQYFSQSSAPEIEINNHPTPANDTDQVSRLDKVSQLRLILQHNLKATVRSTTEPPPPLNTQNNRQIQKNRVSTKDEIILPTLLNQNPGNSRRRVSFETNVVDNSQELNSNHSLTNTVPQSPNTRRRIFNFTPISPGPHSPINNGRTTSKPSSANASPFVSPRNTPVPRSRSNMAGICRSRAAQKTFSRSISASAPYINKNETFVVPTSNSEASKLIHSGPKIAELPLRSSAEKSGNLSFLVSDVNPEKQLVINYPSQENLQEIKNNYRPSQPPDAEISELFISGVKPFGGTENYFRSQSVPLHRMVNPTLMSPINAQHFPGFSSFGPSSSGSSVAPTPVPSEFNDFGSIGGETYLLDEVDANFIGDDQQFLMEDKVISSENITKILNFLDEEDGKGLNILPEQSDNDGLIDGAGLILDGLPNTNLNVSESLDKIIQSSPYSNTPLPTTAGFSTTFVDDNEDGARASFPGTPLDSLQAQDVYCETNEPMLSSPTLNSLNLRGETVNQDGGDVVCRNVSELLEESFLHGDGGTGDDGDDLDPLSNFDGLQDVDSLAPLFNEVNDANR